MKILLRADLFDRLAVLRAEARAQCDAAADLATEVAFRDVELQGAKTSMEREEASNSLRYAAGAEYIAQLRAVRAVFHLRCAEREIESAHLRLLTLQREDEGRARMLDEAMGGKPLP